jgi:catechol 2,3-dioxygenase-like lactoylglutathione lyase family enzyme
MHGVCHIEIPTTDPQKSKNFYRNRQLRFLMHSDSMHSSPIRAQTRSGCGARRSVCHTVRRRHEQ